MTRIGISGLGLRGMYHLTSLKQARDTQVFVFSPSVGHRVIEGIQKESICDSYEDMLSRKLDGVIISSPDNEHFEQSLMAAQKKVHVLLEKPSTYSSAEAQRLIEVSNLNKAHIYVAYQRRLSGICLKAKEFLKGITPEDIKSIHCCIYTDVSEKIKYTSKLFFNIGCHYIDCLNYILPVPSKLLSAQIFSKDGKDSNGNLTLLANNQIPIFISFEFSAVTFPELVESHINVYTKGHSLVLSNSSLKCIDKANGRVDEVHENLDADNCALEFNRVLARKEESARLCSINEELQNVLLLENIYKKAVENG
jgi:predicted dehydrogenase